MEKPDSDKPVTEPAIDHKSLLEKFVKHVVHNEGNCYIDWMAPSDLTPEETTYLLSFKEGK